MSRSNNNNPTHQRRKLATQNPPSISQATTKRHTKHPTTTSTSTIYNLTNHFSMLHTTKHRDNKPTNTHLQQAKTLSKSANLELSNPRKLVANDDTKETKKKDLKKKEDDDDDNKKIMVIKQPTLVVANNNNGSGKRRSLSICDAKKELANFLVTNCAKVVAADMPPFMQIHAVGFARKVKDSLEKFTSKNLALFLKKELDEAYGPAWHCIVGTSFGSFVTHSVGGFLYFSLDQKLYVLIFKTTVQRAD